MKRYQRLNFEKVCIEQLFINNCYDIKDYNES